MKQLKASVPDELAEALDKASTKSGRSLSAEIAHRLEVSFTPADKPSADFLQGVALMAAEVELEGGAAWHKHAGAHRMLTRAILRRLEVLKPEGLTAFGDRPHATLPYDDPDQLGVIIESRLRSMPDFSNSPTRRLMEEEHQRSRAENERLKSSQQKKRGK